MDRKEIVSKLFELEQNHYDKLNNVKKILDKENPVFSLIVNDLSDTIIKDIENLLLDVLEVSNEPDSCKYRTKENYNRKVLKAFISKSMTILTFFEYPHIVNNIFIIINKMFNRKILHTVYFFRPHLFKNS